MTWRGVGEGVTGVCVDVAVSVGEGVLVGDAVAVDVGVKVMVKVGLGPRVGVTGVGVCVGGMRGSRMSARIWVTVRAIGRSNRATKDS